MNNNSLIYSIKDKKIFNIYVFSFFTLFLQSIHVWFLWGNLFKIFCPLFFVFASLLNRTKNSGLYRKRQYLHIGAITFIVTFLALRGSYDAGILSIGKALIGVFTLYDVLLLSQATCIYFIRFLTKAFGVITIISLLGWIMFLLGVSMPHVYIVDKEFGYSFQNYYIFLYNELGFIPRYCSIFLEPGYYAQLAAIILYANKMKINNCYTIAILIGVLFSLSLAGYSLVAIGFFFIYLKRKHLKVLILGAILGHFLISGVKSYNDGNNAVNLLILSRLEFEDGEMAGYNRSGEDFDYYMETTFMQNGLFLFGLGSDFEKMKWDHGVAGYKVYIAQKGYIGLLMAILAYWYIVERIPKPKRQMKLFFLLIMILYWQAAYPFWFCYFALYVTGLANLNIDDENIILVKS